MCLLSAGASGFGEQPGFVGRVDIGNLLVVDLRDRIDMFVVCVCVCVRVGSMGAVVGSNSVSGSSSSSVSMIFSTGELNIFVLGLLGTHHSFGYCRMHMHNVTKLYTGSTKCQWQSN